MQAQHDAHLDHHKLTSPAVVCCPKGRSEAAAHFQETQLDHLHGRRCLSIVLRSDVADVAKVHRLRGQHKQGRTRMRAGSLPCRIASRAMLSCKPALQIAISGSRTSRVLKSGWTLLFGVIDCNARVNVACIPPLTSLTSTATRCCPSCRYPQDFFISKGPGSIAIEDIPLRWSLRPNRGAAHRLCRWTHLQDACAAPRWQAHAQY